MTTEPIITSRVTTVRKVKVHLAARNNGGICHPYKKLARCGVLMSPDVVDTTLEHVNCRSCLNLVGKDIEMKREMKPGACPICSTPYGRAFQLEQALREIIQVCERSDAAPELKVAEIARRALGE